MSSLNKCTWLFGLLISCPMDEEDESCPLNKYRNLKSEEKFKFAFQCDDKEIDKILIYHNACLQRREKDIALIS
ncbi:hypothetical protein [Maribellus maritimus]|uniref:hypothetical protein n=1 Tax=Maribellus maritimus TaxID=2870838 RepID=UPI001EEBB52F|nr:hypothetical protein [Maribellus maritimus]MCG6187235.1 hypothetical protein [Maribellus maritimus]